MRHRLIRTLLHQELLRNGVVANAGILLPSFAHDDAALEAAGRAFAAALDVVAEACADGRFASRLEIVPAHGQRGKRGLGGRLLAGRPLHPHGR